MTVPKTARELNRAINAYFESRIVPRLDKNGSALTDSQGEPLTETLPYTVSGLAYAIGLSSCSELDGFEDQNCRMLINRALLKIESYGEEKLFSGGCFSGTRLFLSKNFPRWSDGAAEDDFDDEDMEILNKWAR